MADLALQEVNTLAKPEHVVALLMDEAPGIVLESIRPRKKRQPHPRGGELGARAKPSPLAQAILRALRTRKQPMSAMELIESLHADYADGDEGKLLRGIRAGWHQLDSIRDSRSGLHLIQDTGWAEGQQQFHVPNR